jgi:hypothetical protein
VPIKNLASPLEMKVKRFRVCLFRNFMRSVKQPFLHLLHCRKWLSPLLAAPGALLLGQEQAKAVLTYNIFESGGDVVVQASGSLALPSSPPLASVGCGSIATGLLNGGINSSFAGICTGPGSLLDAYGVTGSESFDGTVSIDSGSSTSALSTLLIGDPVFSGSEFGISPFFAISPRYSSGAPIASSSVFAGQTLAGLGFTINSGLIGTWTLAGTGDTIQLVLGSPSAQVPGPLPLLGAGAAFCWSRRLRRRIASTSLPSPGA